LGEGGIAPRILDLGTWLRLAVNFTLRPLYPWVRVPGTDWIGGWVGTRAVLDVVVKRKLTPYAGRIIGNHHCGFRCDSSNNWYILLLSGTEEKSGAKRNINYL